MESAPSGCPMTLMKAMSLKSPTPDSLRAVKAELETVRKAIDTMSTTGDFSVYEEAWRVCLNAVEKVWAKTDQVFKNVSPKFQPWRGRYDALRRTDPLLAYFVHARNVDQHTIQEIVEHTPGTVEIRASEGVMHLRGVAILGPHIFIDSVGAKPSVTRTPPKTELLAVFDRGVTYPAPTHHMGDPITDTRPHVVAQQALGFYKGFIKEAQEKFGL